MTLLIGTRSPTHVVVSADGMSIRTHGGKRRVSQLDLQKIFPVEHAPAAIAHHGENRIAGVSVESLLEPLLANDASNPISNLAECLLQKFDKPVRKTLCEIADAEKCAFWVCGFSLGLKPASIIELEWKKAEGSIGFRHKEEDGDLIMSGDGHDLIAEYTQDSIDGQFTWEKLSMANEAYHLRFHAKLWRIAEARQQSQERQLFGGHKHTLIVTRKGWRWKTPPTKQPSTHSDRFSI